MTISFIFLRLNSVTQLSILIKHAPHFEKILSYLETLTLATATSKSTVW
jgi:hypothetical protein